MGTDAEEGLEQAECADRTCPKVMPVLRPIVSLFLLLATVSCGPSREAFLAQGQLVAAVGLSFEAESILGESRLSAADHPSVLAFSGGGPDGAFGAGVILGRADAGRPADEDIVTGISIGALIAVLAFAREESRLETIFSGDRLAVLGENADPLRVVLIGSLWDGTAYADIVAEVATDALIARVANEHDAGRRLFVATTDLDTMRMTVWDMGAIAGAPAGAKLFRRILLASASVPGAYPPVPLIVDGRPGLHVDGGVTRQIYVPDLPPDRAARSLLLVFNNTLAGDPPPERLSALETAQRGISTLIRGQSRDQVQLARLTADQTGADIIVISIPSTATAAQLQDFSPKVMARTFYLGRRMGRSLAEGR